MLQLPLFSLEEICWSQPKNRPLHLLTNPFVKLTLKTWDKTQDLLTSSPSFVSCFLGQSWFPPAATSSSFAVWRSSYMCRFCDIATMGGLLSKETLEQKFGVLIPWFQYQQIYDLYHNFYLKYKPDREITGFENLLYKHMGNVKGVTSIIYKDLGGKLWNTPAAFQRASDRDCPPTDSAKRWSKLWSSYLCKNKSPNVRVEQFKILSRWYLTLLKLYQMKLKEDFTCWKGCGQMGNFFHCW